MATETELAAMVEAAIAAAHRGDRTAAVTAAERAVAAYEASSLTPSPGLRGAAPRLALGLSLMSLGDFLHRLGALASAERSLAHAVELLERSLTPDDPALGDALVSHAAVLVETGAGAAAKPLLERALAIFTLAGPTHAALSAHVFELLATTAVAAGRFAEAEKLARRALGLCEPGPSGALARGNLENLAGAALAGLGRTTEAAAAFRRALALAESLEGEARKTLGELLLTNLSKLPERERQ